MIEYDESLRCMPMKTGLLHHIVNNVMFMARRPCRTNRKLDSGPVSAGSNRIPHIPSHGFKKEMDDGSIQLMTDREVYRIP